MPNFPWDASVPPNKASLWFLGQAGYYMKSGDRTLMIDPYLTDSIGKSAPNFSRVYPAPVAPDTIKADIFIITHDHQDHLDPETIAAYAHKNTTTFVVPRNAAKTLAKLGIPQSNIVIADQGDTVEVQCVKIEGIFALPTGADVLDTTGYKITFANGKSMYHTSDTAFCDLLLKACPKADVLLTCINGKYGNLSLPQAISLTQAMQPNYVIPNHYDVMALNSENPESFKYFCQVPGTQCIILEPMEEFTW